MKTVAEVINHSLWACLVPLCSLHMCIDDSFDIQNFKGISMANLFGDSLKPGFCTVVHT